MKKRDLGPAKSFLATILAFTPLAANPGCGTLDTLPGTNTSGLPTDFGNGMRYAVYEEDLQQEADRSLSFSLTRNNHFIDEPVAATALQPVGMNGEESPVLASLVSTNSPDNMTTNYTIVLEDNPNNEMTNGTEVTFRIPYSRMQVDGPEGEIVAPRIVGAASQYMSWVAGPEAGYLELRVETNGGPGPQNVADQLDNINDTLDDLTSNGVPDMNSNGNGDVNTNGNMNTNGYTLDDLSWEFEQNGVAVDPIENELYATQVLRVPTALDDRIVGGIDGISYTISDEASNARIYAKQPGDINRIGEENGMVAYSVTTGIGVDETQAHNVWDVFSGTFEFSDGDYDYSLPDHVEVRVD
jgi:hypothetical protein